MSIKTLLFSFYNSIPSFDMLQESISSHNIPHIGSAQRQQQHGRSSEMSSPTMHPQTAQSKKKISPDAHHLQQQQPPHHQYPSSPQPFNLQQRGGGGVLVSGGSGSTTGSVSSKSSATRQAMEYGGSGKLT